MFLYNYLCNLCDKKKTMDLNDLTYKIRGAIFNVHNELGPGLLESSYEAALTYELISLGIGVRSQVGLPVIYKGIRRGTIWATPAIRTKVYNPNNPNKSYVKWHYHRKDNYWEFYKHSHFCMEFEFED